MRVLVVTNITPDPAAPSRGVFVRDQVAGLRRNGIEVELLSFPGGRWRNYARAVPQIRRVLRRQRFDLVHAHYGLAGWCASLAGARPLIVTFHGTDVRHRIVGRLSRRLVRRLDLVAGASRALFAPESERPGLPRRSGATAVLPCGADLDRFQPSSRSEARERLGLDPRGRYLLFPAATPRPEKRYDRAAEVGRMAGAEVLTAGGIEAERMPDWVNAASAVLVTSENEGFGLAAVEALACNVPVLSTPVGVAPALLHGIEGCLAEPYDASRWGELARRHVDAPDPRIAGRGRAHWYSAELMAERVVVAYQHVLGSAVEP